MGHQPPTPGTGLVGPGIDWLQRSERRGKVGFLVVFVNEGVTGLTKCDEILDLVAKAWIRIDGHQVVGMQLMLASTQSTTLASVIEALMDLGSDLPCPGSDQHSLR
jgi:hypothetical protein